MIQALKYFLKRLEKTNQKEFGNKKLSCHNIKDEKCHQDREKNSTN